MAWTQTEYDALKAAIASGVQSVRYADRTVTYHSLDAMRSLLASMELELDANKKNTQRIVVNGWKGV